MTKSETGRAGEKAACDYLSANGYVIRETNVRISHDEIDIIAEKDSSIIFAEVKTRHCEYGKDSPFGSPKDAVGYDKKRKLIRSADAYLELHREIELWPRIDVIEVYISDNNDINHIEHYINAVTKRSIK